MRVLFRDVRLIDGVSHEAREHVDVLVAGERIRAVEVRDGARTAAPEVTVVEGSGRTLLPGLIDAHAHYTFDPTEGSLQAIARRADEEIPRQRAGMRRWR
jgi:imidazolonepropionase-like amidohydrolase